jgi:hypothetical protein
MMISMTAVVGLVATMAAVPPAGTLVYVHGTLDIQRSDGSKVETPPVGFELRVGDAINTGADGMARATLMSAGVITIAPGSRLVINTAMVQDDGQVKAVVDLVRGKMRALVGSLFGRRVIFEAKTPNAVAGVRGTYILASAGEQGSEFYSINGPVTVTDSSGHSVQLTAGLGVLASAAGLGTPGPFSGDLLRPLEAGTAYTFGLPPAKVNALVIPFLPTGLGGQALVDPAGLIGGATGQLSIEAPAPTQTPVPGRGIDVVIEFPNTAP